MKIIDNELEARSQSDRPVSVIGRLLKFRALVASNDDEGNGLFEEYNYDASVKIFQDLTEAEAAWQAAADRLPETEEENLECGNESFIALYDTFWGFVLVGGDNAGMGAATCLIGDVTEGETDIPHFTRERMIEDMSLEDPRG